MMGIVFSVVAVQLTYKIQFKRHFVNGRGKKYTQDQEIGVNFYAESIILAYMYSFTCYEVK